MSAHHDNDLLAIETTQLARVNGGAGGMDMGSMIMPLMIGAMMKKKNAPRMMAPPPAPAQPALPPKPVVPGAEVTRTTYNADGTVTRD
jgi:hypothetical protein